MREFWAQFDLDGRRLKLDQLAVQLRAKHDASIKARKQLAEATKGAKKVCKAVVM